MDITLLSLLLPEGLSDYFDFDKVETVGGSTYIYLTEKNIHPREFLGDQLLAKGFLRKRRCGTFGSVTKAVDLKNKKDIFVDYKFVPCTNPSKRFFP